MMSLTTFLLITELAIKQSFSLSLLGILLEIEKIRAILDKSFTKFMISVRQPIIPKDGFWRIS